MKFAIVDIETTGGNAQRDKITEIAVYIHDGEKVTEEFTTLINPECSIPPFISRLTGITNEMVSDAPRFYEIAKQLIQITDGSVFVAHNVAFDYNFIRNEFKSLGYNYTRDYLCTVKLSRKIIPGYRSYSLGNICANLQINIENRHRASGDALATVKLFELLISKNDNPNSFHDYIHNDYLNLRFPPEFNRTILDALPEKHGIYYLHDHVGNIIYIGKSNNIRKRILNHFSNKQSRKSLELRNSIRDISFEETGSELIALLLESDEIKKTQPVFNRALKRTIPNYGIFISENENGFLTLRIDRESIKNEPVIITTTYDQATEIIDELVYKFQLCQKLCGAPGITHACFGYSVRQCNGACISKEDFIEYNKRVNKAVESLHNFESNFLIIGEGRCSSEKSIVQVEKGRYKGFGYFEPEFIQPEPEQLKDLVKSRKDNQDVNRIISQFLKSNSNCEILEY